MANAGNRYEHTPAAELEGLRRLMLERLAAVPPFRRGSLQEVWRKCGNASCHCARRGDAGHGPHWQWTRRAKGATRGQSIRADQLGDVRGELDAGTQFGQIVDDLVEVNEAICKQAARRGAPAEPRGAKKGALKRV
jgi:hypothetical protein